jgi:nucleoside-diphosphate-sugar epimerase
VRIFVAGASGVIGVRLVPLLVARGHTVAGMTRTAGKTSILQSLGAQPVLCDVYDLDALTAAMVAFQPDTVMHQLTDLPDDASDIPDHAAAGARMRREGTHNLLVAAGHANANGFIAQSIAWTLPGDAGQRIADMESAVLAVDGVVIRYGQFYGPGTYYENEVPDHPRIHIEAPPG